MDDLGGVISIRFKTSSPFFLSVFDMPQPLSNYLKKVTKYSYEFGVTSLQKYPNLSAKIAEAIAIMSEIDHAMGLVLVKILHASPEPAFAMFSELMDSKMRQAMILAAARSSFSDEDFETFEAIMSVVHSQAKTRNKFAHGLWGVCEQVSEALLNVDPRYLLTHELHRQQLWADFHQMTDFSSDAGEAWMDSLKYDFDRIYVYRKSEFNKVIEDLTETRLIIGLFLNTIDQDLANRTNFLNERLPSKYHQNPVASARQQLSNQPLFVEALHRLRRKSQNNQ